MRVHRPATFGGTAGFRESLEVAFYFDRSSRVHALIHTLKKKRAQYKFHVRGIFEQVVTHPIACQMGMRTMSDVPSSVPENGTARVAVTW